MDKKNTFVQDNIIFLVLPFLIIAAGLYFSYAKTMLLIENTDKVTNEQQKIEANKTKLKKLQAAKAAQENKEEAVKTSKSGKIIYEVLGQQFSAEASFGIMFENILANITNNGVRIRSIDYNYSPREDKVLQTNAPGYNACELSFTTVGSYSQLQNFFKSIAKENYLTNIFEVYIEPYDKDKNILIAKFKVRLYTKTVHG
ncbi:MAG: hypothetical protein IJB79_01545 [Candidatus Gastranaerophilales bacterium]|nr:hypothetical protein [Candidatus Gastranaerophilales bacterium]